MKMDVESCGQIRSDTHDALSEKVINNKDFSD